MDFSKLNMTEHADKGAVMQVMHPTTGEPLDGVTINLLGDDCSLQRKRLAELRKSAISKSGNVKANIEQIENEALSLRISKTVGWSGIKWGEDELICTPENVRKIYSTDGFSWLVDQVDKFTRDRANFLSSAGNN